MLKLICDNMRPEESISPVKVTLKEQGYRNDIVLQIAGITVAWVSAQHGALSFMNLTGTEATKLRGLGVNTHRPGVCEQILVKE